MGEQSRQQLGTDRGIAARVLSPAIVGECEIELALPTGLVPLNDPIAGRTFLARCAGPLADERDEWTIYARQPLRATGLSRREEEDRWLFEFLGAESDGQRWLSTRLNDSVIHLIGPVGNTFRLTAQSRNFLLVAQAHPQHLWLRQLLPVCDALLDMGGRITLLVERSDELPESIRRRLPLSVEVLSEDQSPSSLPELVRWADQILASVASSKYQKLAQTISQVRFRIDDDFAQVLTRPDLLCGYGACLSCVVPTASGGVTRGCVHGPAFDLQKLVSL